MWLIIQQEISQSETYTGSVIHQGNHKPLTAYRYCMLIIADIGCSLVAEELVALESHLVVDIQAVVDIRAVVDTNDSVSVTTVYRC